MWNWLNRYKIGIPLILFSTIACSSDQRYHCRDPDSMSISALDKMVEVYNVESDQRVVFTYYFGHEKDKFIKTFDKDNVIVTTYKDRFSDKSYELFKIDMSSSPVTFNYGYGYHISVEGFESMYQMPYTEKNFNSVNLNPEIINYIPPKENEQLMSIGFWREDYDCGKPVNLVEYKIKAILTTLLSILAM